MKYYYYYVFFNAYWSSFDIGERTIPRQNAGLYMFLFQMFTVSGIIFLINGLGANFNLIAFIIGVAFAIILSNRIVFSEKRFNERFKEYEFIASKSKKSRLTLFFIIIAIAGCVNIIGVLLFALNGT